jgi:hypothetical protein
MKNRGKQHDRTEKRREERPGKIKELNGSKKEERNYKEERKRKTGRK